MSNLMQRVSCIPAPLRALKHRDFRLYFGGQSVSVLGSWIQQVALSWLVYRLTGSAVLLGLTAFCALAPQLFIGPIAGAWGDKQDKRKSLLYIQAILASHGFLLSLLTWTELITPFLIVCMALTHGVLNSIDTPLRQSLIGSFVGSNEDLPNALALNAMLFNAGRFVGPPIAGWLVTETSEAACFAINGLSYLALVVGMSQVRIGPTQRATGSIGRVFKEGLIFAWHSWLVSVLIMMLIALNLTASSYAVLLPIFAREVFDGDPSTLGVLWGGAGLGAFTSTFYLATRKEPTDLLAGLFIGIFLSAIAMLVFASTTSIHIAVGAMVCLGFGISVCNVGINMLLQSVTPEKLRGRVISFFTSSRFGFEAAGGLVAGLLSASLGGRISMLIEGCLLLAAFFFFLSPKKRLKDEVEERLKNK